MKSSHTIILFAAFFILAVAAAMYLSKPKSKEGYVDQSTIKLDPDSDMTKLIVLTQ